MRQLFKKINQTYKKIFFDNLSEDEVFQLRLKITEYRNEAYKIWRNYGYKSMVMDKRRRNSTRKSNQSFVKKQNRIERSRRKVEMKNEIDRFYTSD